MKGKWVSFFSRFWSLVQRHQQLVFCFPASEARVKKHLRQLEKDAIVALLGGMEHQPTVKFSDLLGFYDSSLRQAKTISDYSRLNGLLLAPIQQYHFGNLYFDKLPPP
ncbi:MAG: hypothetical protein JWO03_3869 [Bacteroidetes bacterium]|nr:hypothetical protein [Bacteroidota bacterium]